MLRALTLWTFSMGLCLPLIYGWVLPRFLLLDALGREIVAWTGSAAGFAILVVAAVMSRRVYRDDERDHASRLVFYTGLMVVGATVLGWQINQRGGRVPYMESFSLLCLQIAVGGLITMLFYAWARAATRATGRRAQGLPGVRGLFTFSALLLGMSGATLLGLGSAARAAGVLNREQRAEMNKIADLLSEGLSMARGVRKQRELLDLLRNEVDLWYERLPLGIDPPLLKGSLVREEAGALIVQSPKGGRFHMTRRALPDGEVLWLIAPANTRPPVWAPEEASALLMLTFLLLGAPIAAFSISHDLQGQLNRVSRNLAAVGAGVASGKIPIDTHDEVGGLIWEVNRTCARFDEDTARLSAELEIAAHSDQARARFLREVSHELHAPLREIDRHGRGLEADAGLTAAQREDVSVLMGANAQLLKHVSDILDLAQLDAEPLEETPTPPTPEPLEPLLRALVRAQTPRPDVTLSLHVAEPSPHIQLPPLALNQIVGNLLSNALKFTREGFVQINAGLVEGGEIEISVSDSGPGIPEAEREAIFQEFHRVKAQREVPGTGLGLAIARRLARRWGGRLRVESVEGEGSTFTLILPQPPAPGSST